ncbi:MAG: transporter substrate-binding domain-containing protein [Sneathiella sp.]|nr:transporter substrate-binding domain-containing protein [Sneathiella sp.]
MRLSTKIYKPYQYYDDVTGDLTGESIEVIKCAFSMIQMSVVFEVVPWKRAQTNVMNGLSDGFFSASRNKDRNKFAQLSTSIADQNWAWYSLKSNKISLEGFPVKKKSRIGAILGSNMTKWVRSENYQITVEVTKSKTLVSMMLLNRIDFFMGNELVVDKILSELENKDLFVKIIERTMPLGIYFSYDFLIRKPDFLPQFNTSVDACRSKAN